MKVGHSTLRTLLIGFLGASFASPKIARSAQTQQQPTAIAQHIETVPELRATLSADQQLVFDRAIKLFDQGKFAEATPLFRELLTQKLVDPVLAKLAAECAVNDNDYSAAKQLIDPVLATNEADWQGHTLRARLGAQSGDKATRDVEIARIFKLYEQGLIPAQFTQYPIERDPLASGGSILIFQSIYPWGRFKVHNYARIFDADGKLLRRITLESSDFDQPLFAKEHPAEAAAGGRRFSYDGYQTGPTQSNGQHTETHATYGFLDKEPTYDEMRTRFLQLAAGEGQPASTNTHPQP
ncbi:tetratricopeptide repeat protein [Granulicella sp. dw_53]|uniref:tetratricopeptide repeat protein n=1 Tax=Granulicella sp. dw_53 TaxID=2719792 RepID=UPI001BD4F6D6|nr:tetratricopeptide repeat protein [Granulicella sp. dw_53]